MTSRFCPGLCAGALRKVLEAKRGSVPTICNGLDTVEDGQNRLEHEMSVGTVLLIILILMLLGVLPRWPHSRSWGYAPSGLISVVLVVLVVLLLVGRI